MTTEHQVTFPPSVLARISPELTLQRHLASGVRPCYREFTEFRDVVASKGNLGAVGTDSLAGSSVVKHGNTHVFCGITLGISEVNNPEDEFKPEELDSSKYTSVFPVVEVARGRQGAPSDEEQILSQKLYNYVYHSRILPYSALEITPGYQIKDESSGEVSIIYPDDKSLGEDELLSLATTVNVSRKQYRFVLYAHVKVFSRDGPLFDAVSHALLSALQDVSLPRIYLADSGLEATVRVPVRSRGNFGHLNQSSNVFCFDTNKSIAKPLALDTEQLSVSSSFGLVEIENAGGQLALLADLEGEAEEACCETKLNIVASKKSLKHLSLAGGGANVTLEVLKKAISLAKERAQNV